MYLFQKVVNSSISASTVCTQNVFISKAVKYVADSPPLVLEVSAKDKGQLYINNKWMFTVNDTNDAPYVSFWFFFKKSFISVISYHYSRV